MEESELIVTSWNKSGNIYCKLGKGDSLFVAYSEKGKVDFKSSWIELACSKQGIVGLIAFIVVDF